MNPTILGVIGPGFLIQVPVGPVGAAIAVEAILIR